MMAAPTPNAVGGYVLAGGKSSRLGQDKALLTLAGKTMLEHAVEKLRQVCMDVRVLGSNPAYAAFAPVVEDLHPGCGPLGGMEAGLTESAFEWNLFMPVDMPFLPMPFLNGWVRATVERGETGLRVSMFTVDGLPQPTLAMIHSAVLPYVKEAVARGEWKLYPVLEEAGKKLAEKADLLPGVVFRNSPWDAESVVGVTEGQRAARHLWFANLNTWKEVREAQVWADACGV